MKTLSRPCFRFIFFLFGFVLFSGCSNLSMIQENQVPIIQTQTGQSSPSPEIPTKRILPEITPTATFEPLSSPTLTVTITPAYQPGIPNEQTDSGDIRVINEKNLKRFIPELNELPDRARYRICRGCENIVINQEIIWSWGKAQADRYIEDTGRINGWSIQYVRGSLEMYAPEYLTLAVQIYNTEDGATLAVNKFNALQSFPDQGWTEEPCRVDFSQNCVYIKQTHLDDGGRETVISRLYFTYHNLVGTITGEGWPEDVVPEFLEDMAYKMYQRMSASPLSNFAALTPTH